jgi:hypothetical protein
MQMRTASTLLLASLLLGGCNDASGPNGVRVYGSPVAVGNGEARTYVVSDNGIPSELGIALSAAALDGLPGGTGPMDSKSFLLPLPANTSTGYSVVELNWNPAGHPPPMVYTVPHFDFHFYTHSLAERNSIVPTDPDFATKAANLPADSLRPPGYVPDEQNGVVMPVPVMGLHWVNPSGPEFNGAPFTHTFIYGSWDGHFTFVEPMVSRAFLLTHPDTEVTVTQPAHYDAAGYRPGGYRVTYDSKAQEYRVGLTQLANTPAH